MTTAINVWTAEAVAAVKEYGKIIGESQLCGTKSPVQGQMLALMAMSEGLSITEVRRRYHIVNGSELSMRADYMRAEFRRRGGIYRWINTGEDGKVATLYVKYLDNEQEVSYSIEDAQREGLVKAGSRWVKAPGDMLRARVSTKAIRMVCTEVLAGFATDEEIEASVVEDVPRIEHAATSQQQSMQQQQVQLAQAANAALSSIASATASLAGAQVDVMASSEQVTEIVGLFKAISASEASIQNALAKRNVTRFEDLTAEQATALIEALKSKLPTTTGTTAANVAGPITAELLAKLDEAIKVTAQLPGGLETTAAIKAKLDAAGLTLSQLSYEQGRTLLSSLENKQIDGFMSLALEAIKPEKNS